MLTVKLGPINSNMCIKCYLEINYFTINVLINEDVVIKKIIHALYLILCFPFSG